MFSLTTDTAKEEEYKVDADGNNTMYYGIQADEEEASDKDNEEGLKEHTDELH